MERLPRNDFFFKLRKFKFLIRRILAAFIIGLFFMGVTGCVNYIGIHAHSKPETNDTLAVPHRYPLPPEPSVCKTDNWWQQFNDPQLNTLMAVALADSPTIQIAASRLDRAKHLAEAAGASLWPSVNLSGYVRREHFTKNGIIPPPFGGTTQNLGELALNFQYELDFWGKNRQTIAARVSAAQAAAADLAQAQLMISTAVATSYFQLQSNIALVKLAKKILAQRQGLLKLSEDLAEHAISSAIPVSSAQIQVQIFALLLAQVEKEVMVNRHQLAILIGKNPFTTQISIKKFQYNSKLLSLPPIIPAHLLGRRPDIAASCWRVEAAAHQVNAVKARFFPDINLMALLSYQSIGLQNLFKASSRDDAIQVAFNLPIFDGGYLRATLKARYSEYDLAVGQYNRTILTALQQVADQLAAIHTLKIQLKEQTAALTFAQSNYHRNYLLYKRGINDYTQVLLAQASWLYQQVFLLELENLHIRATIAMIKALGGDYHTPVATL